jgi:hypothetical protein
MIDGGTPKIHRSLARNMCEQIHYGIPAFQLNRYKNYCDVKIPAPQNHAKRKARGEGGEVLRDRLARPH